MKKLFATTAVGLMLALPISAQAQVTADSDTMFYPTVEHAVKASDLIGKRLYVAKTEVDTSAAYTDADTNWDDIGEVSDVVIDLNGDIEAVLVDVGGFLGIGEKTVAVNLSSLKMIPDGDDADDYFVVLTGEKAMLEAAPAYTSEPAATDDATADATGAKAGGDAIEWSDITSEELTGARVYGPSGEDLGEISEIVMTDDMKVGSLIVDVGGFLGIGEKPVSLHPADLTLTRDGDDIKVHSAMTKDQLKKLPAYEK
ncbi:PRC-barrel domain-containing protein [Rhodobacter lacus]|uniref:PRC-barrel domain-containing protein n=1 Tax=Rhodobacter lacus TaxID=1641972 RepID=A0ABW5A638_9RHOB